jgi:hypothetical protein
MLQLPESEGPAEGDAYGRPVSVSVSFSRVHDRSGATPPSARHEAGPSMNAGERPRTQPTTPPPQLESVLGGAGCRGHRETPGQRPFRPADGRASALAAHRAAPILRRWVNSRTSGVPLGPAPPSRSWGPSTYRAMPRICARHRVSAPSTSWDWAASDRPPHDARTTMLCGRPRPRRHAVAEHRSLRGADCSSVTRRIPGGNWVGPLSCCADCRTGRCPASAERTPLPGARPGCRDSGTTAPAAGWSSEPRRHAPSPAHRVPPGPRESGADHPVR